MEKLTMSYTEDEFFISFESYQAIAGTDKTHTDYIAAYLSEHPHAKRYLTKMSENQYDESTRILDRLPSSFWVSDDTQEYNSLYDAASIDFLNQDIDLQKFTLEEYTENRDLFNHIKMTNLTSYVQNKIHKATTYLFEAEEVKTPIRDALASYNLKKVELETALKEALYVSYSGSITDLAAKHVKENAHNDAELRDKIIGIYAIAIWTPVSNMMLKSNEIIAEGQRSLHAYNDLLKKGLESVHTELAKLLPKKDWEVIANPQLKSVKEEKVSKLQDVISKLEEEKKLTQALVDNKVCVTPIYVDSKKAGVVNILKNQLLTNPLAEENRPFFTRIFNSLLGIFKGHIKSSLETTTKSFTDNLEMSSSLRPGI
jgi:hypothetical protein